MQAIRAVLHVNDAGKLVEQNSAGEVSGVGKLRSAARFAERAVIVEKCAAAAVIVVKNLIALAIPQVVVVNGRTIATTELARAPQHRAIVGHDYAIEVQVVAAATGDDQSTVRGNGDGIGRIPVARHPRQGALNDIGARQIGAIQPRVGAGHQAAQVEVAIGQIEQPLGVGGHVSTGQAAAAEKRQLQSVGAVLNINYAGKLVERDVRLENGVIDKLAGPTRFAERAVIVEHDVAVAVGIVDLLVALAVPQPVVVHDGAKPAAQCAARPGEDTMVDHHGCVHVQIAGAADREHGAPGGNGDRSGAVPIARIPGQKAIDDAGASQIAAVGFPSIGAGHGAVEVVIADFQSRQTELVGRDKAAGKTAAPLKREFQTIRAILHINHTGELVERNAVSDECGGRHFTGPTRFPERAVVVEGSRAAQIIG